MKRYSEVTVIPVEPSIPLVPYQPVVRETSEEELTDADLALLHNALASCDAALYKAASIDAICKISLTVSKLIETRRHVKKMPYGANKSGSTRTFEVLD